MQLLSESLLPLIIYTYLTFQKIGVKISKQSLFQSHSYWIVTPPWLQRYYYLFFQQDPDSF